MSFPTIFDTNNSLTLVNLYSTENPLLEINDECYFLFFNLIDYHIPLLAKGRVIYDRYNEEINKTYFIQLTQLLDSERILEQFLYDKQISTWQFYFDTNVLSSRSKILKFDRNISFKYFEDNLIKTDCFFVRKDLTKIEQLRKEYINAIVSDLNKQITEIKNFQ